MREARPQRPCPQFHRTIFRKLRKPGNGIIFAKPSDERESFTKVLAVSCLCLRNEFTENFGHAFRSAFKNCQRKNRVCDGVGWFL